MNAHRALVSAALFTVVVAAACSPGSTAAPAPASAGAATTVSVVLTPQGCVPDKVSVPTGAVTFNVTNQGADAVSELELKQGETTIAEKENLTPGLSGSFSAQLEPGTYVLECPGAMNDENEFRVTE